ncbi:MAG: aminotransferase class III-fold pyridoxal phosphate-dependent enzyme [Bdellovibrionota bacterium]
MAGYQFSRAPKKVPLIETKHRTIKTEIPTPGTEQILNQLDQVESRSMHGQLPLVWDKAKGHSIYDKAGNKWIDFTSTIFVTNIGHANEHLASSLRKMLDQQLVHSYAYANEPRLHYLKKLVEFAGPPFEKAFLLSAGTEATEAALKLMRMHGQTQGKRKLGVICIESNWHGRTMGAQMMSSNIKQKEWVGYLDPNIHHIPFPYPWLIENEAAAERFLATGLKKITDSGVDLSKDICGFMLETFQGWGAVFYPKAFVKSIERICRSNGALLAFDEMQAGFARTGKRFGFEHYEVEPDLIAVGKGMGSGFPISGVLGRKHIMDLPEVGNMSSTHSANPLVSAAGLATLEEIERLELISETERKGELLFKGLADIQASFPDRISYILGKGLIAAVLFKKPGSNEPDTVFPSYVSERAMQKGLLVVHTGRESIKLGPPLVIGDDALLEGIAALKESITEIDRESR